MQQPSLAEYGNYRRLGVYQKLNLLIILSCNFLSAGGTEGGNLGVSPFTFGCFLEELNVLGITPRPTALHVVHTKGVEFLGHAQFVCDRKTNPFALRAVPQGRVIDFHQILHQWAKISAKAGNF